MPSDDVRARLKQLHRLDPPPDIWPKVLSEAGSTQASGVRLRSRLLITAVGLAIGLGSLVVVLLAFRVSPPTQREEGQPTGRPVPRQLQHTAESQRVGEASSLASDGSGAWIAAWQNGDPETPVLLHSTNQSPTELISTELIVTPTISEASGGGRVAVAHDSVWIAGFAPGGGSNGAAVERIDIHSGGETSLIRMEGNSALGVAATHDSVWALVATSDDQLVAVRVDPATNTPTDRIDLGSGVADGIRALQDFIVVSISASDGDVVTGPTSLVILRSSDGELINSIEFDDVDAIDGASDDLLWIARGQDLVAVDPSTGEVRRQINVGLSVLDLQVDGADVWFLGHDASESGASIGRLSGEEWSTLELATLGTGALDLAIGEEKVWVATGERLLILRRS